MSVYFIQCGGGPIKIGVSAKPRLRLVKMQADSPHHMDLLGVMDGSTDEEAVLHNDFAEYHIRGEWFTPAPSLLAFIKGNARALDPPIRRPARSASECVIRQFGGIRALARALGHKSPTTVHGWVKRGIPLKRWPEVARAAKERGLECDLLTLLPPELRAA